jgi:hypothetical protein
MALPGQLDLRPRDYNRNAMGGADSAGPSQFDLALIKNLALIKKTAIFPLGSYLFFDASGSAIKRFQQITSCEV